MKYTAEEILLKTQKEAEYKEYIENHVNNVQTAWENMKANVKCYDILVKKFTEQGFDPNAKIFVIDKLVKDHDKSKYSKHEFDAYRRRFFPINDEEKKEKNWRADLDKAWNHHYTNNLHHWKGWVDNPSAMTTTYVVEMVCDWIAMSIQYPQDEMAWGWYKQQTDIVLGTEQRKLTEQLLLAYYGYEK